MQKFSQKANTKEEAVFILGSGSPRRRELLKEIMDDFKVVVSDAIEIKFHPDGPLSLVQENARLKAEAVAQSHPRSWVLGADTLVALGDKVLGKPKDLAEARSMLGLLSGQTHEVSTGLCLINLASSFNETRVETSRVTFKDIDDQVIDKYFELVDPLDKAGGYAIQTNPELIVKNFQGSHSNVIGLPVEMLDQWLSEIKKET
jgi:septum formation protein